MTTLTFVTDGAFTGSMTPITQFVPDDSDGDGIPDDEDLCPNSDLSPTVVIDGCDFGVTNPLVSDGCTISDEIGMCADDARNHIRFVLCVSRLANDLRKQKLLTIKDEVKLVFCAGKAHIP